TNCPAWTKPMTQPSMMMASAAPARASPATRRAVATMMETRILPPLLWARPSSPLRWVFPLDLRAHSHCDRHSATPRADHRPAPEARAARPEGSPVPLRRAVPRGGRVILVSEEDDADELRDRMRALRVRLARTGSDRVAPPDDPTSLALVDDRLLWEARAGFRLEGWRDDVGRHHVRGARRHEPAGFALWPQLLEQPKRARGPVLRDRQRDLL